MTTQQPSVLVIDDEPSTRHFFRRAGQKCGARVVASECATKGVELVAQMHPDVLILDVLLPDRNGLDVLKQVRRIDPLLPVVIISSSGLSETAIQATKLGALDYLVKPLDFTHVLNVMDRALTVRRMTREPLPSVADGGSTFEQEDILVGNCHAIQEVYKSIGRVATQDVTVLVRGESGTGKELVARALFRYGNRLEGPFMAVSCAAIPEPLLESELFGHEQGAFTGADRQRIGKFEQCNGGTLFLDEIGDMSLPLQSKMLRVLQEQRFERVGGNQTIQTNVRIIAATNRNLETMVSVGQFRNDLYYRLNGYTLTLPPLRDRGDDLSALIKHFLNRSNRETNKNVQSIAPRAARLLQDYSWPGNIRELQSVIKQAVLQTTGPVILAESLPPSLNAVPKPSTKTDQTSSFEQFVDTRIQDGATTVYDESLMRMERILITRILRHTGGNQADAAQILGITRTTLRTKLRKHGIEIDRVIHGDEPNDPAT